MKAHRAVLAGLLVLCLGVAAVCSFPSIFPWEERFVRLLCETLPRLAVAGFLLVVLGGKALLPPKGGFLRALVWSLPCFAVALVNFPYSALITGSARIERVDLLWLFLLKCLSVALMEELFFRALLLPVLRETRWGGKWGSFSAVLLSAALFSLMHLINLLMGAGWGATALQLGYTFLLGVMFGVMYCITGNVWLCVAVHALFDVGGLIVTDLGTGAFQDLVFWVLTAVVGALCAVHILLSALRLRKKEREDPSAPQA